MKYIRFLDKKCCNVVIDEIYPVFRLKNVVTRDVVIDEIYPVFRLKNVVTRDVVIDEIYPFLDKKCCNKRCCYR